MKSTMLPDAEFEIMEYVWDTVPPVTTPMAMQAVGKARGWKIQTVAALFARLMARGFLRQEKTMARERAFYPLISREQYLKMETEQFVSRYHKNSFASLLNALRPADMTREELDEMQKWLDGQKR